MTSPFGQGHQSGGKLTRMRRTQAYAYLWLGPPAIAGIRSKRCSSDASKPLSCYQMANFAAHRSHSWPALKAVSPPKSISIVTANSMALSDSTSATRQAAGKCLHQPIFLAGGVCREGARPANVIIGKADRRRSFYQGPGRVTISRFAPRAAPAGYAVCRRLIPGPWSRSGGRWVDHDTFVRGYAEQLTALDPQATFDAIVARAHRTSQCYCVGKCRRGTTRAIGATGPRSPTGSNRRSASRSSSSTSRPRRRSS